MPEAFQVPISLGVTTLYVEGKHRSPGERFQLASICREQRSCRAESPEVSIGRRWSLQDSDLNRCHRIKPNETLIRGGERTLYTRSSHRP